MLPWEKDDAPNYYRLYRAALKSIAEKDAQISVLPALTARIRAQRRELAILNRENTKANALAYKRLCELMDARERISVLTAALAQRDEALRGLVEAIRKWHYGRMPREIKPAFNKALCALSAAPRDETCATCKGLREVRGDKPGDLMAWTMPCPDCKAKEGE